MLQSKNHQNTEPLMDRLSISGIKFETYLGVYPWEQQVQQTISLDLSFNVDTQQIAAKDSLEATVNYAELTEKVIAFATQRKFKLLETLGAQIADFAQNEFRLQGLQLKITKLGCLASAKEVTLTIHRS